MHSPLQLFRIHSIFTLLSATAILAQSPSSFKYGTCADVSRTDFTRVSLLNKAKVPDLEEPVRFSVANDGRVFVGERNGTVRMIDKDGSITKLGQVSVQDIHSPLNKGGSNEYGLDGLILDREFDKTGWIYIYYQARGVDISKLSRFKVVGKTLDLGSEQVILSWPYQRDYCCHTGGGMQFDSKGDLWLAVANNTKNPASEANGYVNDAEASSDGGSTSANTNDLRGKNLRIHPLATPGPDGKLYSIPAGNMKEAYASLWNATDLAKVRPEIYTMGHRGNWSLSVDTVRNFLTWGDVGPDEGWDTEEFNLTSKPGNFGFPYFAGAEGNPHYQYRLAKDPKAPTNTSKWNTGAQTLPPAIGAFIAYRQSAAITGPIYHWSAAQTSPKKLPPHFDGKWFLSDFNQGYLHAVTLDDAATKVVERKGFVSDLIRPVQIGIGPDGLLYTLEYATTYFTTDGATQLKRWEYTGPACVSATGIPAKAQHGKTGKAFWVELSGGLDRTIALPAGARGVGLYDTRGNRVWNAEPRANSDSEGRVAIPSVVGNGIFLSRFVY